MHWICATAVVTGIAVLAGCQSSQRIDDMRSAQVSEKHFEHTMSNYFDLMYAELPNVDPRVVARLERDALNNDPQMAAALMRRFGYLDPAQDFAQCPVPIRCINAAKPNPTMTQINRKYTPEFDAVLMQGVDHWPHLEQPVQFNATLREQSAAIASAAPRTAR